MKVLPLLVILLAPFAVGARATLADPSAAATSRVEAKACAGGTCINACPYGGSTEPSAHDCQAAGGYVVGTPDCDDGGCASVSTCVCCEWYGKQK
ncbi:MAG TPA: hypothetical protein VHG93_16945 [Longimicrobium sp.]|nr:hypothetical protein [Longimicrobium sp.]